MNRRNLASLIAFLGLARLSPAQVDLAVSFSESVRTGGTLYSKHQILGHTGPSTYINDVAAMTSALPANADIDALNYITTGTVYFSLDADTRLAGTYYADEDVIRWNGSTFSLAWDGSANGLPPRVNLDALEVTSTSPLRFSFSLDSTVKLTGPGTVEDEDVIFWNGSAFSATFDFDGSLWGVPASANLDSFSFRAANLRELSFDRTVKLGTFTVDDGDAVEWNTITHGYPQVYFIAASQGIPASANLDAIDADALAVPVVLSLFECH